MAQGAETVAEVLGEISRDHLECSICHERYQTPKILQCLHSFCEKCLLTYQESAQDPAVIKCPVCRQLSTLTPEGTRGLKTNFHLMEIVADVALKEKLTLKEGSKVMCELCEDERKAESRCMDCPLFLCKRCLGAHRRIAANHQVLTLDALRSDAASPKVRAEPPCDKHRGEKKRFFCETCDMLICRDCTVVEHRNHTFTTVDDAASRFRGTTSELVIKLKGNSSNLQCKMVEKGCEDDLDKLVSQAKETVIQQAKAAGNKVSQLESDVLQDISERKSLRSAAFLKSGCPLTDQSLSETGPFASPGNIQVYCKTTADKIASIDSGLNDIFGHLGSLKGTDDHVLSLMSNLEQEVQKEAACNRAKISARRELLLRQVQSIFNHRENLNKSFRAVIERMRHALVTAGGIVKSASDGDFLCLHSVVDGDLRALLEQSPLKLHPGYPEIEFKCSDDIRLGHLIGVPDVTWKFVREIVPSSDRVISTYSAYTYSTSRPIGQVTNISLAAYSMDEILVGGQESQAVVIYNVAGTRTRDMETSSYPAYKVATMPDGSFITTQYNNNKAALYSPGATRPSNTFTVCSGYSKILLSIARYTDKDIIVGFAAPNEVKVHNISDSHLRSIQFGLAASTSENISLPCSIQPDFLASTNKKWILVGARSPASVEGLDSSGTSVLAIQPTIGEAPDGKQAQCAGICTDNRDYIYVAVTVQGAREVHVHQYDPYGSFIACLTTDIAPPVSGIAVTGDDTLVVAEQCKLKLFQIDE